MSILRCSAASAAVLALALSCSGNYGIAAEPERGRLADGRAYRTDSQGNQLIDYIAELELEVDSLNRRVQGLEYEVITKQQTIDRLNAGENAEPDLKERDIPLSAGSRPDSFAVEAVAGSADAAQADCRPHDNYSQLQGELAEARNLLEEERGRCRKQAETDREKIALLETSLKSSRSEGETPEIEPARRMIDMRARLAPPPDVSKSYGRRAQTERAPSPVRQRALEVMRGSVNTELNQIGGLVNTRDTLVAQHGTKTGTFSFRPSPAVSAEGLNVEQIRSRLNGAASVRDLNQLRQAASQIKNRIQEDIALIKRMFKLR